MLKNFTYWLVFLPTCWIASACNEYNDRNGDAQNNYSKIIERPLHKLNRFHAIVRCFQGVKKFWRSLNLKGLIAGTQLRSAQTS